MNQPQEVGAEQGEAEGAAGGDAARFYRMRHLRFGWVQLACFAILGITLEALHGLKIGFYLDVANETRRLLWTLAHAHGVLFGLVHIAFAATVSLLPDEPSPWRRWASPCLCAGGLLLPFGFLLGGAVIYGGDPGPGVMLVPLGAGLVILALSLTAWWVTRVGR